MTRRAPNATGAASQIARSAATVIALGALACAISVMLVVTLDVPAAGAATIAHNHAATPPSNSLALPHLHTDRRALLVTAREPQRATAAALSAAVSHILPTPPSRLPLLQSLLIALAALFVAAHGRLFSQAIALDTGRGGPQGRSRR